MGRYYDEEYEELKQKISQMVTSVQEMIQETIRALNTDDVTLARRMIDKDETVDYVEVKIDESVIRLLALQQPMAVDLRFLVSALKINNDLERMGDHAVNIAQAVVILNQHQPGPAIVDFTRMEEAVQIMVRGCIDAFNNSDPEIARAVCNRDDEVDDMNREIIRRLAEYAREHPEHADRCISLLLVSRNLERIADISTNIAEEAVYYIQGRFIKHAPRPQG